MPADAQTAVPPAMSLRRTVGAYLADLRVDLVRTLRAPELFVPVILMPIAFYLLLGVAMREMRSGARAGAAMSDIAVFLSFAIYGATAVGLVNVGIMLAADRSNGLLTLRRALPAPPASYLVAKIAMAMVFSLVVTGAVTALAVTLGGVALDPGQLAAIAGLMILGIAPAAALGLFVATHVSLSAASAINNMLFLGMMMLGGLFYPLPGLLADLKPLWPTYHLQQLGLAAAGLASQGPAAVHFAVLGLVTVVFAALAARRLARVG